MPERPFIPRRTPTIAQPAFGAVDFRMARPFVPSADRERIDPMRLEAAAERTIVPEPATQPIESFLDFTAGTLPAGNLEIEDETLREDSAEEQELPPVEHFIDPLPPIGDFAAENPFGGGNEPYAGTDAGDVAGTEWVETDWQQYDWRAIAALADSGAREASSAWAETDWDAGFPRTKEVKPTAAQAIATALDQIAQKIRDGELALPGPGSVTDPRTIATTLAALLGIRQ